MSKCLKLILMGAIMSLISTSVPANVRLPALISTGMVLQRDVPVRIWGWADDGEVVVVSFNGVEKTATAVDGLWQVNLPAMAAGGPWPMTIRGANTIVLDEVFVGEVWLCSGQSNMVMPLKRKYVGQFVRGGAEAAAQADDPLLRFFTVADARTNSPQTDVKGCWLACNPKTASDFSAVGYFFGRELREHLNVPVGLILAARGGSPMEVWMSMPVLEQKHPKRLAVLRQRWAKYENSLPEGEETRPRRPFQAAEYYNGMIAPVIKYGIRGVIWYQGESNVSSGNGFSRVFSDLIGQWRSDWGLGNFPFLFVQLAPYREIKDQPSESAWALTRAEQARVAESVTNTAMVCTVDLGDDPNNPHPVDKETVGKRLSLAARNLVYGENVAFRAPQYSGMAVSGNTAIVKFNNAGGGLMTPGNEPVRGFALAGPDGKFAWADAQIKGDEAHVSSSKIAKPAAVRYGWADYPVVNLFNKSGLPVVPFRTD